MPDFSQFKKLDITSTKFVDYTFSQLDGKMTLSVAPATEVNKPYFNAVLKRARKTNKAVSAGAINTTFISNSRDEDRELYSKYIIKNWKNVVDVKGKAVEYSEANVLEFLKAIPDHIFDELRAFCGNVINFTDEEALDVEGTAKN